LWITGPRRPPIDTDEGDEEDDEDEEDEG